MTESNDDDIDLDIDAIMDDLPDPPGIRNPKLGSHRDAHLAREISQAAKRREELDYIVARTSGWLASRRVLYVYTSACQHCGTEYHMPSRRVLTEFRHKNGSKKQTHSARPDLGLPLVTEHITGDSLECCPACINQPQEDTE